MNAWHAFCLVINDNYIRENVGKFMNAMFCIRENDG